MSTRRNFIQRTLLGLSAASFLPGFLKAKNHQMTAHQMYAPSGKTILFQGDSITDAGRNKAAYYPNQLNGMGHGYAFLAAGKVLGSYPKEDFKIYNRGISGHKVFQLANRWEDDCLQLKPDVLSILIGVNDYWHAFNDKYNGTIEVYEQDYRELLQRTKEALPDVELIIGEPFAVKGGSAIREGWYPAFDEYRAVAQKIAQEFKAAFIPYQSIFDQALELKPVEYWCPDGVHPSLAGAQLMADNWINAFKEITDQ